MSNSKLRTNEEITRVYNKFVDTVYKVCFVMMKNTAETEDAVSNVFVKYINIDKTFESDEHIKAWLIVTAQNECKNMLKHWFRSKRESYESIAEKTYTDSSNDNEVLNKVLKLDDKYKIPVYLYYYEGYSTTEISKMLKINHSTLRTYMKKAREKLKMMLKEDEEYES